MHRETFSAKLADIQQNVEQLLAELQASEHDAFASHLYRSRQEYRLVCRRAGKGGKPIERCVISTFKTAESMGFKGDLRQWQELLRSVPPRTGKAVLQASAAQISPHALV